MTREGIDNGLWAPKFENVRQLQSADALILTLRTVAGGRLCSPAAHLQPSKTRPRGHAFPGS